MNVIDMVEEQQLRDDLPEFNPGDTLRVHVRIREGDKQRIQVFEGVCIAQKHGGIRRTFTVRKISFGLPSAFKSDRQDRSHAEGTRSTREAVLHSRASRQGGADPRAQEVGAQRRLPHPSRMPLDRIHGQRP